ncbi:MAG: CxxC-x17-CxxC domain-containing protein [Candidatus Omnitrophota bacterium]
MKKSVKRKGAAAPIPEAGPFIHDVIIRLEQKIFTIERKIDTLLSRAPAGGAPGQALPKLVPVEMKPPENRFSQRVMHKAVCADCRKACEVPFKPSGDRPVYCKDCFSKRKSNGTFRPGPAPLAPKKEALVTAAVKPAKPSAKKKPAAKKRKKKA